MACLDTTVLIDLIGRGERRRRDAAEQALKRLRHEQPHAITRFSLAELYVGFECSTDPKRDRAAFDPMLSKLSVLEFDARAMRTYAALVAHLTRLGRSSGVMDMLIGSVALANGQRLVTRNAAHFRAIPGLRVDSY